MNVKKNMVRILAFALVVIMALSILPLASFAEAVIWDVTTSKTNPTANDIDSVFDYSVESNGTTIKTSDYDSLLHLNGEKYDLKGIADLDASFANPDATMKLSNSVVAKNGAWYALIYTPHAHKLYGWYGDATNHWKYCPVCKENFVAINWHYDGDRDRYCDVCGDAIVYYDITVKDSQGGKIIVKEDTAPYRDKINVEIEAASGYRLGQVHFYKVRPDGSRSELTRHKKVTGQSYWFEMPSFNVEIEADFIKY